MRSDEAASQARMESIAWLEWEPLAVDVQFQIQNPGDLDKDLLEATVKRNAELSLEVKFSGRKSSFSEAFQDRPTLRPGEPAARSADVIGDFHGTKVVLRGCYELERNVRGDGELTVTSSCHQVELSRSIEAPSYIVDWLANFSIGPWIFVRRTQRDWKEEFTRARGDQEEVHIGGEQAKSTAITVDHLRLRIPVADGSLHALVGLPPKGVCNDEINPGFIQYSGLGGRLPSDIERRTILSALSFAFGRQFVLLGTTWFTDKWFPVKGISVNGYFLGKVSTLSQASRPAADFSTPPRYIDEEKLAAFVRAYMITSGDMDLEHPLWLVWVADGSPLDAAPAHLGAALEALRTAYGVKLNTKHVEDGKWQAILEEIELVFKEAMNTRDIDVETRCVLSKKLQQLNRKSGNLQYSEFFALLDLPTGLVEEKALAERNRPAHGYKYSGEQYPGLMSTVDALYALFNRIVLRIVGGTSSYVDYSTYDWPSRDIGAPLGGPIGDGHPKKV